jgi:hypothetical protein
MVSAGRVCPGTPGSKPTDLRVAPLGHRFDGGASHYRFRGAHARDGPSPRRQYELVGQGQRLDLLQDEPVGCAEYSALAIARSLNRSAMWTCSVRSRTGPPTGPTPRRSRFRLPRKHVARGLAAQGCIRVYTACRSTLCIRTPACTEGNA